MPTLGEACRLLRISRKTLEKWLVRLAIEPQRHPFDLRFQTISADEIERIREARAQMPGLEQYQGYGFSPAHPGAGRPAIRTASALDGRRRESDKTTYTDTSAGALGGTSLASDALANIFPTHAEACRWLLLHGIASVSTPKTWRGWREVELTPRGVLMLALTVKRPGNHRQVWELRQCAQAECVCHELLPGAPTDAPTDAPDEQTF